MEQRECLAGNPRIYGQLVQILGKYSKFASAGEKANLRQAEQDPGEVDVLLSDDASQVHTEFAPTIPSDMTASRDEPLKKALF